MSPGITRWRFVLISAGVGNATRNAVVGAFVLILASNFLITAMVFG